jgi:hypothetical protein
LRATGVGLRGQWSSRHDLSAEPAQGVGALVLPPDQGAHLVALGEQHCGEVAADGADGAGRSGHEDRAVVCRFHHHIAGLKLRSESLSGVWSFIGQITGPRRSAPRQQPPARVRRFARRQMPTTNANPRSSLNRVSRDKGHHRSPSNRIDEPKITASTHSLVMSSFPVDTD